MTDLIERTFGIAPEFQAKVAASLVLLCALAALRAVVLGVVRGRSDRPDVFYRRRRATDAAVGAVALAVLLPLWFREVRGVATFLGLVAAAMVIVLGEILRNLAGRVAIAWIDPFDVGDRVQIGATTGDVLDIRWTHLTLMEVGNWVEADQSTGRTVLVPNGRVFTETIANHSRPGFLWAEVPVRLAAGADWRRAKEVLREIAERQSERVVERARERMGRASRRYLLRFARLTPAVYTSVEDGRVTLTVRFLCEPHRRRDAEQALWEEILDATEREPGLRLAGPAGAPA